MSGSDSIVYRELREDEVDAFIALCDELDHETALMMLEPGERREIADRQRAEIRDVIARDNSVVLVAEAGGRLVGYVAAYGGDYRRNRHIASIVAGVLQAHAGQGIGRQLFQRLLRWAPQHGISRLELTVMTHNEPAVRLYRAMGFEVEGRRRRSLIVDGRPVDEYAMALLLDPAR